MKIQMTLNPTITNFMHDQKTNFFDLDIKSTSFAVNYAKEGENITSNLQCTISSVNTSARSFCCTCR